MENYDRHESESKTSLYKESMLYGLIWILISGLILIGLKAERSNAIPLSAMALLTFIIGGYQIIKGVFGWLNK